MSASPPQAGVRCLLSTSHPEHTTNRLALRGCDGFNSPPQGRSSSSLSASPYLIGPADTRLREALRDLERVRLQVMVAGAPAVELFSEIGSSQSWRASSIPTTCLRRDGRGGARHARRLAQLGRACSFPELRLSGVGVGAWLLAPLSGSAKLRAERQFNLTF